MTETMLPTRASISVVIPTFNRAEMLPTAIDSVLAQTSRADEVIVVDDGSTDRTRDVLAAYGDQIDAIIQENRGVAAARNAGIARARSEWIGFLDSDDKWGPELIADFRGALTRQPDADVVYFAALRWDGRGILPSPHVGQFPRGRVFERLLEGKTLSTASSTVVRAALLTQLGCFNEERELGPCADWELWMRLARASNRFVFVPRPHAYIRVHPNNMMSDPSRMEAAMLRAVAITTADAPDEARVRWAKIGASTVGLLSGINYYGRGEVRRAREKLVGALIASPGVATRDSRWCWTLLRSLLGSRLSTALRRLKYRSRSSER